jgi:hypothetical protein
MRTRRQGHQTRDQFHVLGNHSTIIIQTNELGAGCWVAHAYNPSYLEG